MPPSPSPDPWALVVVATPQLREVAGVTVTLTREREVYLQLTSRGYGNSEACRIVGINRRTGKRWHHGHHSPAYGKPKPPITAEAPAAGLSRYLREVRGLEPRRQMITWVMGTLPGAAAAGRPGSIRRSSWAGHGVQEPRRGGRYLLWRAPARLRRFRDAREKN